MFFQSLYWHTHKDEFYLFQQNKLRGTFKDIKQLQKIYLKLIKKIPKNLLDDYYFMDCGFGRGEFLELLKEIGLKKVIGIDLNGDYVKDAKKKGFRVLKGDVLKFLYSYEDKFCGISAFHLIEHFTLPQLFDFLTLCREKLVDGGILIMETPNIENITVSSTTFYYDHTHISKLPKAFIDLLLKFVGFSKIKYIPMHPMRPEIKNDADYVLFGYQDLGIIAYK